MILNVDNQLNFTSGQFFLYEYDSHSCLWPHGSSLMFEPHGTDPSTHNASVHRWFLNGVHTHTRTHTLLLAIFKTFAENIAIKHFIKCWWYTRTHTRWNVNGGVCIGAELFPSAQVALVRYQRQRGSKSPAAGGHRVKSQKRSSAVCDTPNR